MNIPTQLPTQFATADPLLAMLIGIVPSGGVGLFAYAVGDSLATISTFARNRNATFTNSGGAAQTAAVNEPRDAHYIAGLRTLFLTN